MLAGHERAAGLGRGQRDAVRPDELGVPRRSESPCRVQPLHHVRPGEIERADDEPAPADRNAEGHHRRPRASRNGAEIAVRPDARARAT